MSIWPVWSPVSYTHLDVYKRQDYVRQSVRRVVVKPYLNASSDLSAWFLDQQVERFVESGIEHGESNSSLALSPNALRDLLDRFNRAVGPLESPTVVITLSLIHI